MSCKALSGGELNSWADKLQQTLARDPRFRDVSTDSQLNGLDARVEVDRERANLYGVSLADVRSALFSAFGDRNVSNIYTASGSYEVILELAAPFRRDETAIGQIQVRSKDGQLVPLANLAHISRVAVPTAVNHSGELPAITVSFSLAPGATLGEATQLIDAWQQRDGLPASGASPPTYNAVKRCSYGFNSLSAFASLACSAGDSPFFDTIWPVFASTCTSITFGDFGSIMSNDQTNWPCSFSSSVL